LQSIGIKIRRIVKVCPVAQARLEIRGLGTAIATSILSLLTEAYNSEIDSFFERVDVP
jgi:hypothetical protein